MRTRDKGKKAVQPAMRREVMATMFRGEIMTPSQIYQRYGRALGFSYQTIYLRVKRGRREEEILGRPSMKMAAYAPGARVTRGNNVATVRTESAQYVATYEDLQRAFLEKAGVVAPALTPSQPPDLDDGSES